MACLIDRGLPSRCGAGRIYVWDSHSQIHHSLSDINEALWSLKRKVNQFPPSHWKDKFLNKINEAIGWRRGKYRPALYPFFLLLAKVYEIAQEHSCSSLASSLARLQTLSEELKDLIQEELPL